ncbi:uncharacterized protein [Miscanthus floridulus]|uniref:uncharacterized protein n=1 Tax=Miscanthus floridulus TaxID=154761 RepID=UPI003458F30E
MWASVRQHQQRMKSQADKGRSERQFNIGDYVFLRLQPYVQSSLAPRAHQKLCFKFFGPYKVVDKIGSVAYKLLLPPGSSIHPVFHVSLLKPAPPSTSPPSSSQVPPPPDLSDGLQVPEKILQRRLYHRGSSTVPQLLIMWSGVDSELAT